MGLQDLSGKVFVTSGLGGMSGAQAKAGVICGAIAVVAEVDGTEITKGQLAIAYERLRRQVQSQLNSNDELSANTDAGLKDRALQALINIQVLKQDIHLKFFNFSLCG